MPLGLRWRCRLRQRWTWWHRHRFAKAALDLGVDTPFARGDARLATKSPDHRVVTWFGISLRCGPAPMREGPHPGAEDGVEIAHVLDLRRGMPLALVDALLMPLIWPLRGGTFSTRLKAAPMRGGAPRDAKCRSLLRYVALNGFAASWRLGTTRNNEPLRVAPSHV